MDSPDNVALAADQTRWEPFRRIGAIVNRAVLQVSPWLPAPDAAAFLRRTGAAEALVVDGDGTPLGVVTAVRLDAANPDRYAGQLMTPIGVVLHESVPLSVAVSLVSSLAAQRIAVVSDGRRAIGVLAASDLLSWSASQKGPARR